MGCTSPSTRSFRFRIASTGSRLPRRSPFQTEYGARIRYAGSNSSRSSGSTKILRSATRPSSGRTQATKWLSNLPSSDSMTTPKSPAQPRPAAMMSGSALTRAMAASAQPREGKTGIPGSVSTENAPDAAEQPAVSLGSGPGRARARRLLLREQPLQRVGRVPRGERHVPRPGAQLDHDLEQTLLVQPEVDPPSRRRGRHLHRPEILVVDDELGVALEDVQLDDRAVLLRTREPEAGGQRDDRVLVDDLPESAVRHREPDRHRQRIEQGDRVDVPQRLGEQRRA